MWTWKDTLGAIVSILTVLAAGVLIYNIPPDSEETKESLRQHSDFEAKCFAVRGRDYYNPDTKERECYNGPQLVFAKRLLEAKK